MKKFMSILCLVLLFTGCESYKYEGQPGYGLEFYRIKDFQRIGNTSKIINSSVILSDSLIISYDNILSYNPDKYTFTVTETTTDYLNDFKHSIHGTPFAVTVDKQLIYTGYFWAGFSSAMVDWVTIDPLDYSGKNQLTVQLGYPGLIQGDYIPDNRNDKRIIDILKRDFKLNKNK